MLSPEREVMTPALKVGAWARAVRTKGMPRVPAASAAALPPTKCRRETERLFDAILQILPCVVAAKPSFSKHTIICPAGAQAQSFMQFGVSRIRWAERTLLPSGLANWRGTEAPGPGKALSFRGLTGGRRRGPPRAVPPARCLSPKMLRAPPGRRLGAF